MKQLPAHVKAYQCSPEFTEESVPASLLRAHQLKEAVWAKIIVLEGKLQYTINEPETEVIMLDETCYGVVEPVVLHEVKPLGKVRFYVEFYR